MGFVAGVLLVQVALFFELVARSRRSRDSMAAVLLYCATAVMTWLPMYYLPSTRSGWAWFLAFALFPRLACVGLGALLRRMK